MFGWEQSVHFHKYVTYLNYKKKKGKEKFNLLTIVSDSIQFRDSFFLPPLVSVNCGAGVVATGWAKTCALMYS